MGKKLNLKWVTEVIREDYKKWQHGDIVLVQSQTGTGKTYFIKKVLIPYMGMDEAMLIVCNRRYLKRQIKMDLIKKLDGQGIQILLEKYEIESLDKLYEMETIDKITKIDNVTILSYHAISNMVHNAKYDSKDFNLDSYKYVVCDEAHFFTCDASFNNRTDLAFDKLLNESTLAIKIFISATLEDVIKKVKIQYDKIVGQKTYSIHEYNTGTDYSYIDVKYIKDTTNNIVNLIKNDTTNEKWLVFVSKEKLGKEIKEQLGDIAEFIKSGSNNEQVTNIIKSSEFTCKVLITTKVFDNGVNFQDNLLKNIVIMTWDRVTFIQMLGRKRIDIDNADNISLYIPVKYKKSFLGLLKGYNKDKEFVDEYFMDKVEFAKKYDRNFKKLPQYLFYKNDSGWKINGLGLFSLNERMEFAVKMTGMMKYDKYAFVKEQLGWMGKYHEFNMGNYVEEVESNEKLQTLEQYIDSLVGVKLDKPKRKELIDTINLTDSRGRQQKAISQIADYIRINHNKYAIDSKEDRPYIDGKQKKVAYWIISRKVI